LGVLTAAAFAEAAALAARWVPWQAGFVVLGVAAGGLIAAALLCAVRHPVERRGAASLAGSDQRPRASVAVEAASWFAAAAGAVQCLNRPGPAGTALAISGLLCVAVSARDDRRPALWLGVALCEAALCVWLFAAGVIAPEAYALPVAAAWIACGWYRARRLQRLSSWVTYGPGLALLLLPSLIAVWHDPGWIRALWLGLLATAVTLIGGRARLQAPLLIGAAVTAIDAGHELAPDLLRLGHAVPTWAPIAATGAVLLWAGATYEARLRNLRSLRHTVSAMR
jgi:hypothetical protein